MADSIARFFWSAATSRRFQSADKSAHSKSNKRKIELFLKDARIAADIN